MAKLRETVSPSPKMSFVFSKSYSHKKITTVVKGWSVEIKIDKLVNSNNTLRH